MTVGLSELRQVHLFFFFCLRTMMMYCTLKTRDVESNYFETILTLDSF